MRKLLAGILGSLAFCGTAYAGGTVDRFSRGHGTVAPTATLSFYFTSTGSLHGAYLRQIEQAITDQINGPVHSHWHTPFVRFGSTGIPIAVISPSDSAAICGSDTAGCHDDMAATDPFIVVADNGYDDVALDHEIIETTVDPVLGLPATHVSGYIAEVCDPVENVEYRSPNNVNLSDFVYPRWYNPQATGQMDYMNRTQSPLDSSNGLLPTPYTP
jgi:hypothetical protein